MYLDDLDPEAVRVELYASGVNGAAPERVEMKRVRQLVGATNGYAYRAGVPEPARRRTIRRDSYRTMIMWRFLWKMLISCGSGESVLKDGDPPVNFAKLGRLFR